MVRLQKTGYLAFLILVLLGVLGLPGEPQGLSTLSVTQIVEPSQIFVQGSGVSPETATVTLQLGAPLRPERLSLDVMLVVDRSASFPIEQAVDAAERVISLLAPEDRVGLVSFATEGRLDARLTPASQAEAVREALRTLTAEGKTALGEGIAVATDELIVSGRTDALWVEILLTDGRVNFGRDPLEAAQTAADQDIKVYAVGVGRFVNRDLLTQIAELTGGEFFSAFNDAIVDQIKRQTTLADEPVVREIEVVETLGSEVRYERALQNPPALVTPNADGTTTLTWRLSALREGEIWQTRFTVSAIEAGFVALTTSPSYVRFLDFRGREVRQDLPSSFIDVRPKPRAISPAFRFEPQTPTRFDEVRFFDESTVERGGRIVAWLWDFGDGTTSAERNPVHRYLADGVYTVTLTVTSDEGIDASTSRTITVSTPPQEVSVDFRFEPESPTMLDDVAFFDETTLSRGEVIAWLWDFGDGTTSTEQNPTHRYAADGEYTVTLTVVTDEGVQAGASRTLVVFTPKVTVAREIDTFIPIDQTIPGQTFRVTITIQANVTIYGLGLDENVPEGWPVKPVSNSTAELRSEDLQWLFSETLEPGTTKTIVYEITVPKDAKPGTYRIDGAISSASPRLSMPVDGDNQIEISSGFPIRVVIAHWDVSNKTLDLAGFPEHTIDLNQILQAIAWWREGVEVPFTEDENGKKQTIDFRTIQELVAYWLTGTSVFEPLP
jgi:chitodextrinase